MSSRVYLQPAYILYAKPFRDTSLLLEAFTQDYGRISLVARGGRGSGPSRLKNRMRKSRFQGLLQPFTPLLLSWQGSGELLTLTAAEHSGRELLWLQGQLLICGLYINEMIVKCLHRFDAHAGLFKQYHHTLSNLQQSTQLSLRCFEKRLVSELGFASQLNYEASTGCAVKADQWYRFHPGYGVIKSSLPVAQSHQIFRGSTLLALHTECFTQANDLQDAKRLLRLMLDHLLGDKTIRTRELLKETHSNL